MAGILLMEPDRLLANSYAKALLAEGHDVFWRVQAQDGLGALDDHKVDLIILELQLMQHNGVEFLHEVRSYPEWDDIPVLLHTMVASDNPGLGRQFWPQLGIAGYCYKPQTSLSSLTHHVNRLLKPLKV